MSFRGSSRYWLSAAKRRVSPALLKRKGSPSVSGRTIDGRSVISATRGNDAIYRRVADEVIFSCGKIGDSELRVLKRFIESKNVDTFFRTVSRGHELEYLHRNAGVFPVERDELVRWAHTYLEAVASMDVLGVWNDQRESQLIARFATDAELVSMRALEPYYHAPPWSSALKGRRVLVVSPFRLSILRQWAKGGKMLFPSCPDILPEFDIDIVQSPFSACLVAPVDATWHAALERLSEDIALRQFDVCLIGAGAWSLPLAAFVTRRLRRTAVHLGGATQILFGLRGRRWDSADVGRRFYNAAWTRPLPEERPEHTWKSEWSAYW
jgi:hypothetical protein